LEVLLTLATVVETERNLGNREHAERTLATIENGYTTLVRFFSQATGLTAERETELWSRFIELGERLTGYSGCPCSSVSGRHPQAEPRPTLIG